MSWMGRGRRRHEDERVARCAAKTVTYDFERLMKPERDAQMNKLKRFEFAIRH